MSDFIEGIIESGGEVYVVGGAVRNIVFNKIHEEKLGIKDQDVLVRNIPVEKLIEILGRFGKVKLVGQKFGVVKFDNIDIALPRTEISTGPGYKNFKIVSDHTLSLEEDFKRRDATINALGLRINNLSEFKDLENFLSIDRVIDPSGFGLHDIKNRLWRAVGDPIKRFLEDPTRIMRALRQCAEMGLTLETETRRSISDQYSLLNEIINESIVRLTEELVRLLLAKSDTKNEIVKLFFDCGMAAMLGIPFEGYNYVIGASDNNCNIRIQMACLLSAHSNLNCIEWTRHFELSAAPHFKAKTDVGFIKCVHNHYNSLGSIKPIEMRRLIQSAEKDCPNFGIEYTRDLITYYSIIQNSPNIPDPDLLLLYNENKHYILKTSELKLDGHMMNQLYNITGTQIADLKQTLFQAVTDGSTPNTKEDLIKYIATYGIKISFASG
ncbi:MAG: hypothetical protein Hyperionvirus17_11 [Hyperionvirus sp.]|uniref:Poly A polymerase head domain-containing protein n=1 Tax=Hyperionvirus sp. TaxID=2487770 RepID=A0A3G5ACW5_9VIRU|nr:MAG: hypothetical protein Hyperionvirus17_11 [Hyperionvirus sp.]